MKIEEVPEMSTPGLPGFTRRIFLHRTLQSLGALASLPLAGLVATGSEAVASQAEVSPVFLSIAEMAILGSIADSFIPHGGAFEIGASDVNLAQRIDRYLPKFEPAVATGFRGALAYVEEQSPAMAGKPSPFSQLGAADRAEVLEAMLRAGGLTAGIFLGLKYVVLQHFYTMDVTWQHTGYDGPMLLERGK
jgi:hypothetical protein